MNASCRYLIMAGGTGGHIFPAMAVARALTNNGSEIHWLGTEKGMESQLVPSEGIPLHLIPIKGFRGKGLFAKLSIPFLLLVSIVQAMKIIVRVNPKVVVGFGGYVAAPGGIAARLLGKKLIVHEQNSVAGSTNKLLSKIASSNLEAFPNSLPRAIRVGNPVRTELKKLFHQDRGDLENGSRKKLLIMGGSLGAAAINQVMPGAMSKIDPEARPEIWHQAGKNKHEELIADYKNDEVSARVDEFIKDVSAAYEWADIIICRAGALTVSEVAVAGIPAIFIPYPYAIDNHQFHNAEWLVKNEASHLIEQKDLTIDKLNGLLKTLLSDESQLNEMSARLKKLAIPDATDKVVWVCEKACRNESMNLIGLKNEIERMSMGDNNNAA